MAGYIGSKASVVSSGAEHKKVFDITTTTTSLTGLVYTPTLVHVFHNGVRLVDGTDYTATSGTTITLTVAAENGDQVVVISYATFQTSDTVSASAGGTFAGNVNFGDNVKAIFGAGSDLQIYHNGNDSVVRDAGTGDLLLAGSTNVKITTSGFGETMAAFTTNGSVDLYHNNVLKLATTATGISVTGDITPTGGVYLGGTAAANLLDDYEEGDWTPVIADASSGGNVSPTAAISASYIKIGRSVTFDVRFSNVSTAGMTAAAQLYVQGLPFNVSKDSPSNWFEPTFRLIANG